MIYFVIKLSFAEVFILLLLAIRVNRSAENVFSPHSHFHCLPTVYRSINLSSWIEQLKAGEPVRVVRLLNLQVVDRGPFQVVRLVQVAQLMKLHLIRDTMAFG